MIDGILNRVRKGGGAGWLGFAMVEGLLNLKDLIGLNGGWEV